jgi:DNA-binding NtrC family response regulator
LEIKKRQKAILFSGFSKTERVKTAQELGAGEFIMKPYLIERLSMTVRNELDRK